MQVAWKQNQGIGVDVHVHRITNRLGWCRTEKAGPEATRQSLEAWFPRSLWHEINPIFVGFGQTTCFSQNPKCSGCPVNNMCPSVNL
jgi:endonuclease-3